MLPKSKLKLPEIVFKIILFYLLVCFVLSSYQSYKQSVNKTISRNELVDYAQEFLQDDLLIRKGNKLDCSGYTQMVYRKFRANIPRSSSKQFSNSGVSTKEPKPGDLVFFSTNGQGIGHVGIFIGENKFIHSPGLNKNVRIDSLTNNYYFKRYKGSVNVIFDKEY